LFAGVLVCPFAATLAGCYWLASYEDLTSGAAGEGGEAGADAEGRPVVDAQPAAQDAGSDTGPGPFCPKDAGPYSYCMDFDGVDAATLGLGSYEANARIVTGTYVSPPSSLYVGLGGTGSSGAYSVAFPFKPTISTLEFEMRVTSLNQWVTTLSISLSGDSVAQGRTLNVVVSDQGAYQVQEYFPLDDGGNEQNGHPGFMLDGGAGDGQWHHVVLSLTVDDTNHDYFSGLTVDGQVLEANVPLALAWAQGTAYLGIGVTYGGGGGPQFYFDNVRADFTP